MTIRGYCAAVRSALTDDGRPPLVPSGLKLYVAVIVHGLGEHSGRYDHVAQALADKGAAVYAGDHHGHGESAGEKGLIEDIEPLVDDTARVVEHARGHINEEIEFIVTRALQTSAGRMIFGRLGTEAAAAPPSLGRRPQPQPDPQSAPR